MEYKNCRRTSQNYTIIELTNHREIPVCKHDSPMSVSSGLRRARFKLSEPILGGLTVKPEVPPSTFTLALSVSDSDRFIQALKLNFRRTSRYYDTRNVLYILISNCKNESNRHGYSRGFTRGCIYK